jgi:exosortase H (IPTLxxWG-CTERM-specific)
VNTSPRRFVLVFLGVLGLLLGISYTPAFASSLLAPYLAWSARVSAELLGWLGQPTMVEGTVLRSAEFAIDIRRGCDAYEPLAILAAGICAFPAGWGARLRGLATGAVVLLLLNFVRILSLFLLGQAMPDAFDMAHEGLWQAVFIAVAVALWALWARRARRPAGQPREEDAA